MQSNAEEEKVETSSAEGTVCQQRSSFAFLYSECNISLPFGDMFAVFFVVAEVRGKSPS